MRRLPVAAILALSAFAAFAFACPTWAGAIPPTIQFLVAPAPGDTVYYAQFLSWIGNDSDGTVSLYRYTIDPGQQPFTFWFETERTQQLFFFTASLPVEPVAPTGPILATTQHTFVVKAVDNEALESAEASRTFRAFTWVPEVQIVSPTPNPADFVFFPTPTVTIGWQGVDWDGAFINRPVKYKYRIYTNQAFEFPQIPNFVTFARTHPDSLRKLVAPAFANWDSTSGDSNSVTYTNMTPDQDYLFAVVGFDEASAYSARFSPAINLLWFRTGSGVGVGDPPRRLAMDLSAPSPNPAHRRVAFRFALPREGDASLIVYDATGRQVRTLVDGRTAAGPHDLEWDLSDRSGRPVETGLYVVRLVTAVEAISQRFVVTR